MVKLKVIKRAAYLLYNQSVCTTISAGIIGDYIGVDNNTPFICPAFAIKDIAGTCNCGYNGVYLHQRDILFRFSRCRQ